MTFLKHLSRPGKIGSMTTRNRIVMPPMVTNFADPEGFITRKQIDYYRRRAKGGVGYITFEHTSISRQGKLTPHVTMIAASAHRDCFKTLVEEIHREECPVVVQINHAGRQTSTAITGVPIVAPSPIPCPIRKEMPKELNTQEIQGLVREFADAAKRVQDAGADGVEIQMGHGGLICSFLSPFSNERQDDYGGTIGKRAKFALDILRAVRKRVGADFPVICRMSIKEYVQGGLEIEDTMVYARLLEENGASALHLSAASSVSIHMNHPPYYVSEGVHVPLVEKIRQVVDIPLIAVGRIRDPRMADRIIETGTADFVTMGRALISDPFLPRKAINGSFEDIVPCISCNRCIKSIRQGHLACTVNPEVGREGDPPAKAESAKQVMVVGGGPAGMKAAQTAAKRGHRVTLYEKKSRLGGMVLSASKSPSKDVLMEYIHYQCGQLEKAGVEIRFGATVTPEAVNDEKPDTLVVATGARQGLPGIPGIDKTRCHLVEAVYSETVDLGNHVVIVGGGATGAELADFVSETGTRVTLIEMEKDIAVELVPHLSHFLKKRLDEKHVQILTSTEVIGFEGNSVVTRGPDGLSQRTDFDSVVPATGFVSDRSIAESVGETVGEVYVIGDAKSPREIIDAVSEGWEVGRKI